MSAGVGVRLKVNGNDVISFASNDYLGLSAHPKLAEAATAAIKSSGSGSSASPLLAGFKPEHDRLQQLAKFKQSEAALVFSSGFSAALATITALAGPNDVILADRLAHASLLDATRLSGRANACLQAQRRRRSQAHLGKRGRAPLQLIVAESLYSMDGDVAPLEELVELSAKSNALLLVDEAHATGVLGASGRGVLEEITRKISSLPRNIIALGTLSKALGSQGGFICARREIVETIVHAGRAYLFSTALAPAAAGRCERSLEFDRYRTRTA